MSLRGGMTTPEELVRIAQMIEAVDDPEKARDVLAMSIRALIDAADTVRELSRQRDHWRSARRTAMDAGDMMHRQLKHLRTECMIAVEMARTSVQHLDNALTAIRNGDSRTELKLVESIKEGNDDRDDG